MIMMICSVCGIGYTEAGFAIAKKENCWLCGNGWFYSNNPRNRETMRKRLAEEARPIPEYLL
jgi:hypothetical protein